MRAWLENGIISAMTCCILAAAFTFYNIVPNVVGGAGRLADDMAEYRERTGNSIVLCCMPLVPQGFPASDRADALIAGWRDFAAACRARDPGLRPGVLIQSFIGHSMFDIEEPRREGWTRSVVADGRETRWCPLDPSFRAYVADCVRRIAAESPAFVMTDDDLRVAYSECFCPLHAAELNRRTGKSLSPDEWRRRISSARSDDPDCLAFSRLMRDTVRGIHALVRSAIDEVDPSIPAGVCEGGEEWRFSDSSAVAIAAKGQRPVCRLASGLYLEQQRGEYPFQASLMRQQTIAAVHTGEADLLDEADTFPQNLWSRSAVGLHTHLVSAIMNGLKGAKVWFVNAWRPQEGRVPVAYTDLLAEYRGFYQVLAEEVAAMRPAGVATPLRVDPLEYHPCRPFDNFARGENTWAESTFSHFGVPFFASVDLGMDAVYELAGTNMVMRMTDGELRSLLSRKLLVDGRAALALCRRGYADLVGVDVAEKAPPFTFEAWTGTRDTCGPLRNMDNAPGFTMHSGATALTYLRRGRFNEEGEYTYQPANAAAETVAPGTTLFTNSLGGVVCATAYGDYALFFSRFHPARKRWLDRVLRELNGGVVDYTVLNEQDFSVLVRESGDGRKAVVAALNFNFQPVPSLEVAVSSRPERVELLAADGSWREAEAQYFDGKMSIKASIPSWGVAVVRVFR